MNECDCPMGIGSGIWQSLKYTQEELESMTREQLEGLLWMVEVAFVYKDMEEQAAEAGLSLDEWLDREYLASPH